MGLNKVTTACLLSMVLCQQAFGLDVAVPEGAAVTWVAPEIEQSGIPLQIQQLKSGQSVEQVLNFYRTEWADAGNGDSPGFIEKAVGEWNVISRLDGGTNIVIQVKAAADGSTEGFLSVADVTGAAKESEISQDFPRLSGSELISSTASRDPGKSATTLILRNRFSVSSNTSFYQSRMPSKGWQQVHAVRAQGADILLFNKNGNSLEVAVTQDSDGITVVLANFVVNET